MATFKSFMSHLRRNYKSLLLSVMFCYCIVNFFIRGSLVTPKIQQFGSLDHREEKPLSFKDSELLKEIKQKMVLPSVVGLNLSGPVHTGQVSLDSASRQTVTSLPQIGQAKEIFDYFHGKKNGFFVEAGAWDGEYLSNTLFLEVNSSWTGLLVEPNRAAYSLLVSRHRAAHTINSCLSVQNIPSTVEFDAADVFGGINQHMDNVNNDALARMRESIPKDMRSSYRLQCYPLHSLLEALGNPRVDFLSLDIEGAELAVLKTLPWDKVDIELVMIEINHSDKQEIDKG